MYIVDAHAWIEYFRGTEKGKKAAKIIDSKKTQLLTLECTLAEIKGWALREKVNFNEISNVIRHNSNIVHITAEDWLEAAVIRFEMRKKISDFGFIDALLSAVQKRFKCKILTGDPHFSKFDDVVLLK